MEIETACLNLKCIILIQVFYMLICYILFIPKNSVPPAPDKSTNPICYMLQHETGGRTGYISFVEEP